MLENQTQADMRRVTGNIRQSMNISVKNTYIFCVCNIQNVNKVVKVI